MIKNEILKSLFFVYTLFLRDAGNSLYHIPSHDCEEDYLT